MNPNPVATCQGKVRFETFRHAKLANGRRKKSERPRMVYRCHLCEGYHLGSRKAKSARRMWRRPTEDAERYDSEERI